MERLTVLYLMALAFICCSAKDVLQATMKKYDIDDSLVPDFEEGLVPEDDEAELESLHQSDAVQNAKSRLTSLDGIHHIIRGIDEAPKDQQPGNAGLWGKEDRLSSLREDQQKRVLEEYTKLAMDVANIKARQVAEKAIRVAVSKREQHGSAGLWGKRRVAVNNNMPEKMWQELLHDLTDEELGDVARRVTAEGGHRLMVKASDVTEYKSGKQAVRPVLYARRAEQPDDPGLWGKRSSKRHRALKGKGVVNKITHWEAETAREPPKEPIDRHDKVGLWPGKRASREKAKPKKPDGGKVPGLWGKKELREQDGNNAGMWGRKRESHLVEE